MLRELSAELTPTGQRALFPEETRRRLPVVRDTDWIERPQTRGDCVGGPRPCPWASCRHNLFLDVDQRTGSLHFAFGDRELWDLPETCALDIADRAGATLDEVGRALGVTRERVRQQEERLLAKIKDHNRRELGLPPERAG